MITQETALRIVKQAEEQYDPGEIRSLNTLTTLVGRVTGKFLDKDDHAEDGTIAWLDWGMDGNVECVVSSSSEKVAEELAERVNAVVELLNIAHDQEKKLHAVIMAYRALKTDIKKHEVQAS